MKRTLLFSGIALFAFLLVGCNSSESPDMHLLELKGNVKSVTYYTTSDVNSKGKKTRQSRSWELNTYNLNKDGQITSIDGGSPEIRIARNKKGLIETISEENPESDYGCTRNYIWNANDYPITEEYMLLCGEGWTCNILYSDSNEIIGKTYYEYWEGECIREWSESYTVMQVDEQRNWTRRLCKTIGNNIKFSLEERVITYYEDTQSNSLESLY